MPHIYIQKNKVLQKKNKDCKIKIKLRVLQTEIATIKI